MVCRSRHALRPLRAWALLSVILVALIVPSAPPASARETIRGHIQIGHFESGHTVCLHPPSRGCVPPQMQGLDRYLFVVDAAHHDRYFWINGTGILHDLDIYFFDSTDSRLESYTSSVADEEGFVPDGATYGIVVLFEGFDVDFTFESGKLREG